ncbi:MAG: amidohydrolase family protein [Candidatus Kapabacteria bacterium]|nr:amidohydrolase family protein [Candidatus Kapabacteria bacterium]MDW8225003.1 amidohydrolase family protein [Bacteroidota bacterium]
MWWFFALGSIIAGLRSPAQLLQTRPVEGLREKPARFVALTNLTVVPRPGQRLERATVIVRDEVIEAVGIHLPIPAGATVRDCSGLWLYPAFIESYLELPTSEPKPRDEEETIEAPVPEGARHWNDAVCPERRVVERVELEARRVEELRAMGFALLHCGSREGIFRGRSALLFARPGKGTELVVRSDVAQWLGFRKGGVRTPYPGSLMGAIALVRQTLSDAQWYRQAWEAYRHNPHQARPEVNLSLQALAEALQQQMPFVVETENEHTLLRALFLMREFGVPALYVGSGREYRRLPSLLPFRPRLILPLAFPAVPEVTTPEEAADVPLEELKHWDAAPQNPFWLDSVGIRFAFTTYGHKELKDFMPNLRRALRRGLSPEKALAALTTVPAEFLGVADIVGTIEPGKLANLLLCDGELFEEETAVRSVFVAGTEYPQDLEPSIDTRGVWSVTVSGPLPAFRLRIEGKRMAPEVLLQVDTLRVQVQWSQYRATVAFSFAADTFGMPGIVRFSGTIDTTAASGMVLLPDGRSARWQARRDSAYVPKPKPHERKREYALSPRTFPDGPFGLEAPPLQRAVLFRNATVWTCSPAGVLRNTDVFIRDGKIIAVAPALRVAADTVVDATGKHLTPGIIDEHSHIAIEGGVNEATHAVTAEVRIGDVVDPDDVNIYRQLAGGVTSAHLLHGSANPIGGQCQLIKLRWGADAQGMKFEGGPATIKFALGENVKQSNWGDRYTRRYPQTRLGVEEIMRDAFQAAVEYEAEWMRWRSLSERERRRSIPPRRDFQLDAVLEILRGKRFIHCHSYVQSEILMLMRLAEEYGFRVRVFTHVLEGYKVARELAQHGAGASSFSDWWAYKFEVYDAIPENPAIMYEQGVLVAINSDDAEMGRRLAQEAGKSVQYGGVPEEEALKFVTLNPARMLQVDHRVGSIQPGKDADIVLWSAPPLSSYAVVEQTYVDGRLYFDRRLDEQLRQRDARLRRELEQRALRAVRDGEKVAPPTVRKRRLYHCEDREDEARGYEGDF